METILVLGETDSQGLLTGSALEALTAAQLISQLLPASELVIGLVGADLQRGANQVAGCGAVKTYGVEGEAFSVSRYSSDCDAASRIAEVAQTTIIVAAGNARWMRALPGMSWRLQGRVDSHVCGIALEEGTLALTRWYYRQRMKAVFSRQVRPWTILVDPGCFERWSGPAGESQLEFLDLGAESYGRTRVVGFEEPELEQKTIRPEAELLFVAGAGWTKKQPEGGIRVDEAETAILGFLQASGASLGGSKSVVDIAGEGQATLSFMTHLNQIGQTGSTPRHSKGLATCCHGEEPHVVGWRFVNERRAVNIDPNCGWAQGKADILYVEDAFAVLKRVNELLAEAD